LPTQGQAKPVTQSGRQSLTKRTKSNSSDKLAKLMFPIKQTKPKSPVKRTNKVINSAAGGSHDYSLDLKGEGHFAADISHEDGVSHEAGISHDAGVSHEAEDEDPYQPRTHASLGLGCRPLPDPPPHPCQRPSRASLGLGRRPKPDLPSSSRTTFRWRNLSAKLRL